jgi:predicted nucleotidyltransferase
MRIDPKSNLAGYSALVVRRALRKLRHESEWTAAEVEAAAGVKPSEAGSLVEALREEGLIERTGRGWSLTQAGRAYAVATAAQRVTRATAQEALDRFMERVARVNTDPYFLGKVTRVVLFGSMLKPETERPSDVDLAVEVAAKETGHDRLTELNYDRVEDLMMQGHRFRNTLEIAACWYREVFRFLKGGSRVVSLADYKVEKRLILAVPHRMLLGDDEPVPLPEEAGPRQRTPRRSRNCPF